MNRIAGGVLALCLAAGLAAVAADDTALDRAQQLFEERQFDRAAEVLRDAIAQHPDDPRLHFLLGRVYRNAAPALPEEARAEFETTLRLDPAHPQARPALAETLALTGHPEEAEGVFREWVEAEPDNAIARAQLGAFLQSQGRTEEGAALLEQAAERDPGNPLVWLELGQGRLRSGDDGGAITALERARDLDPRSAPIRYNLAQAYLGAGREAEAEVELELYQELQAIREERKSASMAQGQAQKSIALREEALRQDPAQEPAVYAELVNHYLSADTEAEGRRFLTSLSEEHPDLTAPLIGLALIDRRDSPAQAREWLRLALARDPHSLAAVRVLLGMADTPAQQQEVRSILAGWEGDTAAPPERPLLQSRLEVRGGDLDEAERVLQVALEERPDDPEIQRHLALLYAGTGRQMQALQLLQNVTTAQPADPEAWYSLARLELRLGLRSLAAEHLDRAVTAGEDSPEALNLLAAALIDAGDKARARELLERSLAQDPRRQDTRELLEAAAN